jgi:uncharacterized protein YchJ
MEENPPRLEDTDPELAELFRQVANHEHPTVKSLYFSSNGIQVVRKPTTVVPVIGRNDPCTCGSGKKYKKCCG